MSSGRRGRLGMVTAVMSCVGRKMGGMGRGKKEQQEKKLGRAGGGGGGGGVGEGVKKR